MLNQNILFIICKKDSHIFMDVEKKHVREWKVTGN